MNTFAMTLKKPHPWYREPWPWLLMSGPCIVVVAGLFTAWIAYTHGDPVISEDYYRKGLAAPQTLASSERARVQGLQAEVRLQADDRVQVHLSAAEPTFSMPPNIRLTLSHPTRAGLDQTQLLHKEGTEYRGRLHLPASGHWLLLIEDDAGSWRMLGKVILPSGTVKIDASAP